MEPITATEAAFFLLLFSANFKWDNEKFRLQGELSEECEHLILKSVTRLTDFKDISSQKQVEEALNKWNKFIGGSISTEDVVDQLAEIFLKQQKFDSYILFYLCCKIVLFNKGYSTPIEIEEYFKLLEDKLYLNSDLAYMVTTNSLS